MNKDITLEDLGYKKYENHPKEEIKKKILLQLKIIQSFNISKKIIQV